MSNTGFDLKRFLDDQRAQGEAESVGSFTIAQDKALTKLAHFALPGTYDWVLKVVQAANAWKATTLVVRQTRQATSFFFRPPTHRFPKDHEIVAALTSGNLDNTNPVYMLCMALRSLVDQAKLSFVLAIRQADHSGEPIYAGADISKLDSEIRRKWAHLDRDGLRLTVSHFTAAESVTGRYVPFLSGFKRRDTLIAATLEAKAYASATTIFLDGRRLTEPAQVPEVGSGPDHRAVYLECWGDSDQEKSFLYPVMMSRRKLSTPPGFWDAESPWYVLRGPAWRCLNEHLGESLKVDTFRKPSNSRTRHSINWLRHGVLVGRSTIDSETAGTSVAMFVPATGLRSDLSGLSIDFDEDTLALEQRYAQQLSESLERLQVKFSRIAGQSVISLENFEEEQALEEPELRAGFSIYTTSIIKPFELVGRHAGSLLSRGYEKLGNADARARFLVAWCHMIPEDLEQVRTDLSSYQPVKRRII